MKICTLASSSKGNSTIIFNENTKILIDCGLSLAEIENKLSLLNIEPIEINAILITHEHIDHTKGVGSFSRKYNTPIYCHECALNGIKFRVGKIKNNNLVYFTDIPFTVGDFTIQSFILPHDVPSCVGYNIFEQNKKFSYATDLGHITDEILKYLFDSQMVILEANHDVEKLMHNPNYSYVLKKRILGDNGHLSNIVCAEVISKLAVNNVKQVVLAHLSEENNTPDLCYSTVCNYLNSVGITVGENIKIDIAGAYRVGPIFVLK